MQLLNARVIKKLPAPSVFEVCEAVHRACTQHTNQLIVALAMVEDAPHFDILFNLSLELVDVVL